MPIARTEWIKAQQAASRGFAYGELSGAAAWERRQVALLEDLVELVAAIAEKLDVPIPEPPADIPPQVAEYVYEPPEPERRSRWHKLFHPRG